MSSVEADVQRKVRLQDARSALVQHIVDAFGFVQPAIHAGFPVPIREPRSLEPVSRVG
jgi:hypothetical protein